MLSFLGRPLPPAFELLVFVVAPGGERPYDRADWRDALVVVERGEIELEWQAGPRRRFPRGAVLWLSDLPLRALHNRGREPAVLVAVYRRRTKFRPVPHVSVACLVHKWPDSPVLRPTARAPCSALSATVARARTLSSSS
jgi:quercetin dioxygenase-like cupin family protein